MAGRTVAIAVEAEIDRVLKDPARVVTLGESNEACRYTTPEILRAEQAGIRAAEALQERSGHAEKASEVRRQFQDLPIPERNAVAKAVSGSDLVLIEGKNGSEMQAVQRSINEALRKNLVEQGIENFFGRKDLLWVAPTATAASELKRSVGAKNVATLQKLLYNLDRDFGDTVKHHAAMLANAAGGASDLESEPALL